MYARITLDTQFSAGEIDRRIFSGFLEHLGRAIYEGIYDPGNHLSDENGFRQDVMEVMRPMAMPLVRYPGGNFVSAYDWRDGIGPRAQRPARPDYAWKTVEPNTFGLDEFAAWCKRIGSAPMLAVNLGTGNAQDAAALVEYCNMQTGTAWADKRAANGNSKPHGVKVWCLGNEMDGPWQAGQVPAREYAQRAQQAGKIMKGLDPTIELVAAGSSGRSMPTYMEWDREVLEYCWDTIDFISAHRYSNNDRNDSAWFLAEGIEIDRIIQDYEALLGYVRALKKTNKRVHLSFDEWNVWYKQRGGNGGWKRAPHLLEEVYNLEDALVCAQYLNSFIRHADTVKMACLAQIVNVIAPVLTRENGVLVQSSYYPIVSFAQHAKGRSLKPLVDAPIYKAGERGEVPAIDASACYDMERGEVNVFVVNRVLNTDLSVELALNDASFTQVLGMEVLSGSDPKMANSWEKPNTLKPVAGEAAVFDGKIQFKAPRLGFIALRTAIAKK